MEPSNTEPPCVTLSLAGNNTAPRTWTASGHLRIGRLPELEVALDDLSVSRLHAEVYLLDEAWVVRDRGSSNGTVLNGVRIGRTPQPLRAGDTIQIGALAFKVELVRVRPIAVRLGNQTVHVEATARRHPDPVDTTAPVGAGPGRPGFLRLVRAAHRLTEAARAADALQALVDDARVCFGARRAAVFLVDDATGHLGARHFAARGGRPPGKTLAAVALRRRQSLLFADRTEVAGHQAESGTTGDLNSVICAVLRAPDRAFGALHLDRGMDAEPFTAADLELADTLADAVALGLDRQQLVERNRAMFVQTVTALAQAVEMRDEYTGNHTQRVTTYALLLADELGLPDEDRKQLQVATLLHDIGKIGIDDAILRKPGRLSDAEFAQMKTHVLRGAEIVQMIPGLAWALPVVRGHHERWDGRGYPDALKGEEIPLTARVVAVADAFDAMTSDRPYRAGMPAARAFAELQAGAGTHFDPACVEAFTRIRPQLEALLEREARERRDAEAGLHTLTRQELDRERAALAGAALAALRDAVHEKAGANRG
ncbi:HD domain-containing protein [Gemmata sp. JC717]|uniref:HD domain-containing phosphohydrolase n=1 Tax=Gemmata algarum TaxID=2975278 RepID=UPI0021BB9785|nr:HD domain-containing phosphohydrolase [Gemmata algarum]MDY3552137.1 HD domain-containing protein [Gemmata algarum]